ncbi:MAG: hypothetical protein Kow00124_20390 [Anaerolineae bacterium]
MRTPDTPLRPRRRSAQPIAEDTPTPAQNMLALSVFGLALGITIFLNRDLRLSSLTIRELNFVIMYVLASLTAVRLPYGLYMGLMSAALLGAALTLGLPSALLCSLAGTLAALPLRLLINVRRSTASHAGAALIEMLGYDSLLITVLPPLVWLFDLLGAPMPLPSTTTWQVLLMLGFSVVYYLLVSVVVLLWLRLGGVPLRPYLIKHRDPILLTGYVVAAFAPLITLRLVGEPAALLPIGLLAFLVGALLLRGLIRAQLTLKDRVDDLHMLTTIGQALNATLDLDDLLGTIYREIGRMLDTSGFYIALYDEAGDMLHFPLAYEGGRRVQEPPRRAANGVTEYVIRSGVSLSISRDVLAQSRLMGLEPVGPDPMPASFLAVPITAGRRVLGVLGLRNYETPNAYSDDDRRLLEAIAAQAGTALQNAKLFETTRARSRELEALYSASKAISASLSRLNVLRAVSTSLIQVLEPDSCTAFLLDGEGLRPSLRLLNINGGIEEAHIPAGLAPDLSATSAIQALLAHQEVASIDEIDPADEATARMLTDLGLRSGLLLPLAAQGQPLGLIAVGWRGEVPPVAEGKRRTALALANQAAIAVDNARLFEQTDVALKAQLDQIAALETITLRMTRRLDLTSVIEQVITAAAEATGAELAEVALHRPESDRMELVARLVDGKWLYGGQWLASGGITGLALRRREVVTIDNVGESPDYIEAYPGIRSEMAVPILLDDQALGVINLESTRPAAFQPQHARFVSNLARQAAIAIQNARLFERVSQQAQEFKTLRGIAVELLAMPGADQVLELLAATALEQSGAACVHVYLYNRGTDVLTPAVRRWRDPHYAIPFRPPRPDGLTAATARSGKAQIVHDTADHPLFIEMAATPEWKRAGIQALVSLPIKLADEVLGVVNLGFSDTALIGDETLHFLDLLIAQVAIALSNARLIQRVTNQVHRFQILQQIALELLSTSDLKQVLGVIARETLLHTSAQDVHIYLYNQAADRLTFGTSRWRSGEVDREFAQPRPDGLTATVARSGRRLVVSDMATHPLFKDVSGKSEWQAVPVNALIGMPLKRGDEVIGVFNLAFERDADLGEDLLDFLDLLAAQAAVAITNARYAEQLRIARDRLQAILDSIHDGIVMFDREGRLVLANPRLEYLLNLRAADRYGEHFTTLLKDMGSSLGDQEALSLNAAARLVEEITANPALITRRRYTLTKPTLRAIEEISTAVQGAGGELLGRLFVLRDVTEQYELEQYRQDMSHMIVHDLRSPLGGVITGLQLALDELQSAETPDPQIVIPSLDVALNSANGLLNLVETMLDVNRLEMGEMPLRLEPVDIGRLVQRAFKPLRAVAEDAGIAVSFDIPEDLPPMMVDADKIERVMLNLYDNALRFTPREGQIVIQITPGEGICQVTVSDTGPGVPEELRERIFERFVQAATGQRQRGSKGSGLGLTFCRLAVEAHGGRIWVTDSPIGGAAFHFTLPTTLTAQE